MTLFQVFYFRALRLNPASFMKIMKAFSKLAFDLYNCYKLSLELMAKNSHRIMHKDNTQLVISDLFILASVIVFCKCFDRNKME